MIVKNVSGAAKTLVFDRKTVVTLANNASATIADTVENMAAALTHQAAGTISITAAYGAAAVLQLQDSPQHALVKLGDMAGSGDTKYLTLSDQVFEFDDDDTYTDGRTPVTIDATDQLTTAAALKAAINANTTLAALGVVATDVLKVSTTEVYVVVLIPDTLVLGDFVATASATPLVVTKVAKVTNNAQRIFFRALTADATSIPVVTGLTTIRSYSIQVRAATGVIKAYDGIVVVSGGTIRLTAGSATVNLASTDVVTMLVFGE